MSGDLNEQLAAAQRERDEWRASAAAARLDADREAFRLELAEQMRDSLRLRVAELVAGNGDLYSDLTTIITTAEASGSYAEIAGRARDARSRLPQEGL